MGHLSRQNDLLTQKVNTCASTHEKELRNAHKARDIGKTRLATEASKVTALEKEVDNLKALTNQLEVEKASLVDEHQREVNVLKKQIADAEKDAAEADQVCKTWNAASDMYENVLSNLHNMVAPILSPEMEQKYQDWLAIIKVSVKEPREVEFIAPEAYDSDEAEGGEDVTTPLNEPVLSKETSDAADPSLLNEALVAKDPLVPNDPPADVQDSTLADSTLPSIS